MKNLQLNNILFHGVPDPMFVINPNYKNTSIKSY